MCYTGHMDIATFAGVVAWVASHGYPLILLGMFIEGPIITTAAGFAAGMGYLNPFILYGLSILGDFLGDTVYYVIGYWHRDNLQKHGHRFGLSPTRITFLENLFARRPIQALAIIKTTPFLTGGLFLAGATRMPYRKYITLGIVITAIKNIPLMTIGYLAGAAHNYASRTLHFSEYLILGGILTLVLVSLLVEKISKSVVLRMEKPNKILPKSKEGL